MGRVSRYKKVKSCDPYYRGPRRSLQSDVDQRPENVDDQPVPKALTRLMKSAELAKTKGKKGKKGRTSSGATTPLDASKPAHSSTSETLIAGRQGELGSGGKEMPMFHRRRGEALRDYYQRIDVEANARIMESYRKGRKMSEKRKKYLEERRRRLKSRKRKDDSALVEVVEGKEQPVDFSDLKDEVRFGEVVSAPPRLNAKPRGSQKKPVKERTLLLHDKLAGSNGTVGGAARSVQHRGSGGLRRQRDLEEERERAIETYRQSKRTKLTESQVKT